MKHIPLYNKAAIAKLEQIAISIYHISPNELMRRAANAALQVIQSHYQHAKHISICCGQGNNGGDGYVLACLLKQAGYAVTVVHLGERPIAKTAVSRDAIAQALDRGLHIEPAAKASAGLMQTDVIVDALLGIGLTQAVRDPIASLVQTINESGKPVVALDVPTGLCADTGTVLGDAVKAACTVTFIGYKPGLFTHQGKAFAGQVWLDRLDLDQGVFDKVTSPLSWVDWDNAPELPERHADVHKGQMGHVLVVGGNQGMAGACALAGQAAYRSGAGLVSVATHPAHTGVVIGSMLELMVHGVKTPRSLKALLQRASVIVLGPGLGQNRWAKACFRMVMQTNKPCVIDADALNLLATYPRILHPHCVLTPHPGEAARLLGIDVPTLQADRFKALSALVKRYGATVVLKGAGTLVASPQQAEQTLCAVGNPGMACGGMGDVLSGIIGGLLAQHVPTQTAAILGVCAHARAADLAGASGQRGLIASDLFPPLVGLLK